jgi:hypothetical protein
MSGGLWEAILEYLPIAIDVIVERELFVLVDVSFGEYTHAYPFSDDPFGNIAVGIARVISESTFATAFCCIDVLLIRKTSEIESWGCVWRIITCSRCNIIK